jgi:SAM-dependent methyltransferase
MTEVPPDHVRAQSFGAWAREYDRYRPSYPPRLFDVISASLALPEHPRVADIGAGTGKAALAMAARGWPVTAVDPGDAMLDVLRARAQAQSVDVDAKAATAEATGLPDAAFELVTAAEAYHWFDAPRAIREFARILVPGGGLACFWNVRDASASRLVADYHELAAMVGSDHAGQGRPGPRDRTRDEILANGDFEEPRFEQVPHPVPMTGREFIGLAFTTSHVRTAPEQTQRRFRRALEALLRGHGIGPDDGLTVPYVIDCWTARRRTDG